MAREVRLFHHPPIEERLAMSIDYDHEAVTDSIMRAYPGHTKLGDLVYVKYKPKLPGKVKKKVQKIVPTKNVYGKPYNLYNWMIDVAWIDGTTSTINEDKLQLYKVYISKNGKTRDAPVIANIAQLKSM